ncbi:MAG: ATP-binding cassette domain-containing protein [Bacillota bacterium]
MIKLNNVITQFPNFSISYPDIIFPKNKITFIIGKNGTGKTTLLKSIAKLVPYRGSIEYKGVATCHMQEPILFNRSVYDNIIYPLKIRHLNISDYEEPLLEYAKTLEIDTLLTRASKSLSAGEKMKVSILRSIIFKPDILLLDEPTTHLDLTSIQQLTVLIKKLKQTMTIVIVSHNQAFIDELQDEIYQLGGNHVYS